MADKVKGRKALDITGQTYHKLTAIKYLRSTKQSGGRTAAVWLWQCECGKQIEEEARRVKHNCRSQRKSCGCWHPVKKNFGWKALANSIFIRHYNDGNLTIDQFVELSQQNCFYCCAPPSNKLTRRNHTFYYSGLDRLDNSKPHDLENVVPCCWICNERKSNWDFPQFINWITSVYQHRIAPSATIPLTANL